MNHFETVRGGPPATERDPVAPVASSRLKRMLDVSFALLLLIFLAPFLMMTATLIWLEDRKPVIFRQRRTGLNGGQFRIYKFRTMRVAEDGHAVQQATRDDDRITRVGAILRALSIDELPQLVNVLLGDMSLVGPRPHALAHDEAWRCLVPGYNARFRTRPGLTGLAQVRGYRGQIHKPEDVVKRVEADNFYIDNWSVRLELTILLKTIPLVFRDPKAY